MNDMAIVSNDNKKYIKVNEYEALLVEGNNNNLTKSIKYEERLVKYEEDYKGFDSY